MGRNRLFGTDGIRGHVSSVHLQPENMVKLGRIIGYQAKTIAPHEASVTIGRDTRASGVYVQHALMAGISSMGVNCHVVGILPTALMAYCAKLNQSTFGVMISASHNPYHDNGIKLFDSLGLKIDAQTEQDIEHLYFENSRLTLAELPGKIIEHDNAKNAYFSMLDSVFGADFSLPGQNIVIDCAHGAAFAVAQDLFKKSSGKVTFLGCSPDGHNINRGFGSEAPQRLIAEVINQKADIGIAFDGDADRVVFVDERGEMIEGDAVLALMARYAHKQDRLPKNTMVATVMSSVALDKALAAFDIRVIRADVGDKFVAQKMAQEGLRFGGENSGHLIFFPECTTGDGIFSALQFLRILKESGLPASKLKEIYTPSPRLLKNLEVSQKIELSLLPKTKAAIDQANQLLLGAGRVMFRYSGTENKARILVEANSMQECLRIAQEITQQFSSESGQSL